MKTTVLLLLGGESSEHEVSITSARNVYAAIDKERYDVRLCCIEKTGRWHLLEQWEDEPTGKGQEIFPVLGSNIFRLADDGEIAVDVLFPVLHGKHGEDGDVQGVARLMHIPCVGPSLIGAAVTMDKDVTRRLLRNEHIPTPDWRVWDTSASLPKYSELTAALGAVLFVKPVNAGSSVGVSKVKTEAEYLAAMRLAAEHDSLVMIEQAIDAREIEVAVLGNGADVRLSAPGEVLPGEEFYSYEDKYSEESQSSTQVPSDLSPEIATKIKEYAATAYMLTRGQGMARVDFFLDRVTGDIYLNEINAIPGFTDISMYPKMMAHDGLDGTALVDRLIELARAV